MDSQASQIPSRYLPCDIFRESGIRTAAWFEDAVHKYSVPTIVFDLYLLVPDIHAAAETLMEHGWSLKQDAVRMIGNSLAGRRQLLILEPPPALSSRTRAEAGKFDAGPTTTKLLPASEWNYELTEMIDDESIFPPLPHLLDALIDTELDMAFDKEQLWDRVTLMIFYLYSYAPALKQRDFAELLKFDHRQYHYDVVAGMDVGTLPFSRHERRIRDALRESAYELCECSAPRDDPWLWWDNSLARLKASRPAHLDSDDTYGPTDEDLKYTLSDSDTEAAGEVGKD